MRYVLAFCACALAMTAARAAAPTVRIAEGEVAGMQTGKVSAYLGIPFAAAPTGANRWRAPQPVRPWSGVRDATHFGANCIQPVNPAAFGPWTHEYLIDGPVSEDCLYLNVWTPDAKGARLPVLVWIHGGGFNQGSGSVPVYNGAQLAEQGIIVVTLNYRLGALGFLAHPLLTKEAQASHAPPGNYGLEDMLAALRWVHANIAAFGGDPDAVTIDGQSAGAMAVHDLMASPLGAHLFRGAITESGLPGVMPLVSLAESEQAGAAFAHALGADSLAAMRRLPAADFTGSTRGPRFTPIVDGVVLGAGASSAAATAASDVPLLLGANTDESTSFGAPATPATPDGVADLLKRSYGEQSSRFRPLYPAAVPAWAEGSIRAITRDRTLAALYAYCEQRLMHTSASLFVYSFDHPEPGPEAARYRAFHSAEIPYVFKTFSASPERGFTDHDRDLANVISGYWVAFVKTGNPNGTGRVTWPAFTATQPSIMELGDTPGARPILAPAVLLAVQAYLAAGGTPSLF